MTGAGPTSQGCQFRKGSKNNCHALGGGGGRLRLYSQTIFTIYSIKSIYGELIANSSHSPAPLPLISTMRVAGTFGPLN